MLSRAGRGTEPGQPSHAPGATNVAGGEGSPAPGPTPAPGQRVPSIPAAWGHPIPGNPIAGGSELRRAGLGARLQAGTDPHGEGREGTEKVYEPESGPAPNAAALSL